MNSKYRPRSLYAKLDEAEMLADGAAADHIRDVKEDVGEYERNRFVREFRNPVLHAATGILIGAGLMWLILSPPVVPL